MGSAGDASDMAETLPFIFLRWMWDWICVGVREWVRASVERRRLLRVSVKCLSNQSTCSFGKPAFRAIDSATSNATRRREKQHTCNDKREAGHDRHGAERDARDHKHGAEHDERNANDRIAPTGRAFEEIR
jgi:hypothetical protein